MFGRRKPEDSIVDQIARNAQKAGLGQKPAQEQTPQPGAQAPTLQPAQPQAPAFQPAQPAKRPRKAFGATRTVARGIGKIWRLTLTILDLVVVAIVLAIIVLVLHGLIASNALHAPASVGRLIDFLYRLVILALGAAERMFLKK